MEQISYETIVNKWWKREIQTTVDLDTVLSNYRILFAYHSNRIENAGLSLHQTREIFENGKVINYTGDTRALFETQNQRVCYEYLKEKIIHKDRITPELIRDVHVLLNQGCYDESRWLKGERPGTYKKNYYGVGDHVGVLPEDVEDEIRFICDEIQDCPQDDWNRVLMTAAYFHCNFENVHAFADGNGRAGRTLMNYFLMIHNLPPTIIYDDDKRTYYMALSMFDATEELEGFVTFLKEQTVKTWVAEPKMRSKGTRRIICL